MGAVVDDEKPNQPPVEGSSDALNDLQHGLPARTEDGSEDGSSSVRFETPGDGTSELVDAFNAWSEILTSRSIETAFALIAGNWAVHGSVSTVMANAWAKGSIGVTLAFLGINLVATWKMAALHDRRIKFAEEDHSRWASLYKKTAGIRDPWPYTAGIEKLGKFMRALKVWAPAIAAVLFLIALF